MKQTGWAIIILYFIIYMLPLGVRPLAIPDEVRYAEISREMIATGDFIVPRINGLKYFEKPALGYWLNALAIKVFGENEFSVRFFSSVCAGLCALMVFFLGSNFAGGIKAGLLSAGIYLSFFQVFALGVYSLLDGIFSFFLNACLFSFFLSRENKFDHNRYYLFLVLSGIFCGAAFLTKGFLGFAIPFLVIAPFMLWENDLKKGWKMLGLIFSIALIPILPWSFLIHLREPDFWRFFFWHEHIRRFFHVTAQHKEPFYFYFMVLPLGAFPWTFQAPAAIAGIVKTATQASIIRYLICWAISPILFLSVSSGKLPTYILPCFLPLSILLAVGMLTYLESGNMRRFNAGVKVLMAVSVGAIMVLLILQAGVIDALPVVYQDRWKTMLLVFSLLAFVGFLGRAISASDYHKKLIMLGLSPCVLFFSAHFLMPDKTFMRKCPGDLIERNKDKIAGDTLVFSPSTPVRAVNWYLKHTGVFMLDKGELAYALEQEAYAYRYVPLEKFQRLAGDKNRIRKIALIIDKRYFERIKNDLPEPSFMDSNGDGGFLFVIFQPLKIAASPVTGSVKTPM